jgi:hypothetical protein
MVFLYDMAILNTRSFTSLAGFSRFFLRLSPHFITQYLLLRTFSTFLSQTQPPQKYFLSGRGNVIRWLLTTDVLV